MAREPSRFSGPCCGFLTHEEPSPDYEICFGPDDGDPRGGGANHGIHVTDARQNFESFGATSRETMHRVRDPRPDEHPPAR